MIPAFAAEVHPFVSFRLLLATKPLAKAGLL